MANTTITVQPGVMVSPQAKVNVWSSGLCDCCEDMGICCFGFWCPCCLMCSTSQDLGECVCLPLLDMCRYIVPPVAYAARTGIRERFRIQGTMCDDCCVVTCCTICAWCQIARELKMRRQREVFVNPPVNMTYQVLPNTSPYQAVGNQSYQQPPTNPAYQPFQPNSPPYMSSNPKEMEFA